MAQQVVEGLERRQLVPTGHGERTAALATRLGESLRLPRPELVGAPRRVASTLYRGYASLKVRSA